MCIAFAIRERASCAAKTDGYVYGYMYDYINPNPGQIPAGGKQVLTKDTVSNGTCRFSVKTKMTDADDKTVTLQLHGNLFLNKFTYITI